MFNEILNTPLIVILKTNFIVLLRKIFSSNQLSKTHDIHFFDTVKAARHEPCLNVYNVSK